jgi:hypothetical protein
LGIAASHPIRRVVRLLCQQPDHMADVSFSVHSRSILDRLRIGVTMKDLQRIYQEQAIRFDVKSDHEMWKSALFCSRIVVRDGQGDRGKSLGLADDMGRSVDTVEDRAHAYWLFEDLCGMDGGKFRRFVFQARRASYIKLSHFRALYDVRNSHKLSDADTLSLLMDIMQAEGGISSRNLEDHARGRFGDNRGWEYYAQRTMKEIHKTLQHPETPKEVREVLQETFNVLGDQA